MPEPAIISQLRRELLRQGCPPKAAQKILRETAEHFEDLQKAALTQGNSPEAATAHAAQQLGEPRELAARHVQALRNSSWFAQHAFITFVLVPLIIMSALGGLGWVFAGGKVFWDSPRDYIFMTKPWAFPWIRCIFWGGLLGVTGLMAYYLGRGAQRFAVPSKWMAVAGGVLALHNLFVQVDTARWGVLRGEILLPSTPTDLKERVILNTLAPGQDWKGNFVLARAKENLPTPSPDPSGGKIDEVIVLRPSGTSGSARFVPMNDPVFYRQMQEAMTNIQGELLRHPPASLWRSGWGAGWRMNAGGIAPDKTPPWLAATSDPAGTLHWQLHVTVPFPELVYAYSPKFWTGGWPHWLSVWLPLAIVALMERAQWRQVQRILRVDNHPGLGGLEHA